MLDLHFVSAPVVDRSPVLAGIAVPAGQPAAAVPGPDAPAGPVDREGRGRSFARLDGELHAFSLLELAACLGRLAVAPGGPVVLDLAGLGFVDAAGWCGLSAQLAAVRRGGVDVRVVRASRQLHRLLVLLERCEQAAAASGAPADLLGDDGRLLLDEAAASTQRDEAADLRQRVDELVALTGQLQTALDSRVAIERAVGVLAERHALDVAAAFEALRRSARAQRRPLREVAAEVVDGVSGQVGGIRARERTAGGRPAPTRGASSVLHDVARGAAGAPGPGTGRQPEPTLEPFPAA